MAGDARRPFSLLPMTADGRQPASFQAKDRVYCGHCRMTGTVLGVFSGLVGVRHDIGVIRWEAPAYLKHVPIGTTTGSEPLPPSHPDYEAQQSERRSSENRGPVDSLTVQLALQRANLRVFRTRQLAAHPAMLDRYRLVASFPDYPDQVDRALRRLSTHVVRQVRADDGPDGSVWEYVEYVAPEHREAHERAQRERARNEDWIRILQWTHFFEDDEGNPIPRTVADFLDELGVGREGKATQRDVVTGFMQTPAAEAVPEAMRQKLIRQRLLRRHG